MKPGEPVRLTPLGRERIIGATRLNNRIATGLLLAEEPSGVIRVRVDMRGYPVRLYLREYWEGTNGE